MTRLAPCSTNRHHSGTCFDQNRNNIETKSNIDWYPRVPNRSIYQICLPRDLRFASFEHATSTSAADAQPTSTLRDEQQLATNNQLQPCATNFNLPRRANNANATRRATNFNVARGSRVPLTPKLPLTNQKIAT